MDRTRSLAVVLALLCGAGIAAPQPPPRTTADPVAGERHFRARGCHDCHAADLARFRAHEHSLPALAAAMWNHFPAMAERIRTAKMSAGEMADLVAYVQALMRAR